MALGNAFSVDEARGTLASMSECPTCKRPFEDGSKPLTTLSISIKVKVAPGDIVLRSHVVDQVHEAMVAWMHDPENSWDSIPASDEPIDLLDIVIAR